MQVFKAAGAPLYQVGNASQLTWSTKSLISKFATSSGGGFMGFHKVKFKSVYSSLTTSVLKKIIANQTGLEVIAVLYWGVRLEDDARKLHFNLLELRTISPPGWFSVHTRIHPKAILGGICMNMLTIAWKTLQVYQPSDICKVLELKKAIKGFECIPVSRQFLMCVTASNSAKSIAPHWERTNSSQNALSMCWVGHMVEGDTTTRNSNPSPKLVCQPRNCSHEEGWVVNQQLQNVEESNAWLKHPWHLHNTKLHCARARGDLHEGVHHFQPK